jgi:phosphoribosylaminoimidazole (AIR) synthetase
MLRTFNMGLGMVVVVPEDRSDQAAGLLGGPVVGRVTDRPGIQL